VCLRHLEPNPCRLRPKYTIMRRWVVFHLARLRMRQCHRLCFDPCCRRYRCNRPAGQCLGRGLPALLADFNQAIDSGAESQAQKLVDRIATAATAAAIRSPRSDGSRRASQPRAAHDGSRPPRCRFRAPAVGRAILRGAMAGLGDRGRRRFGERRFVEAAQDYDLAIEIIKNETLTPALRRNSTSKA